MCNVLKSLYIDMFVINIIPCIYMLRIDCKPDQFINGPPVYNPVGLLLINTSK